ncbi:hypothetical protein [Roseibium limicola]|uniref:Uncharacterized protein n=1 Tax=Roseibium limicola TaxID=2816037 RepID=A0A939J4E1_9HYPH|nr:hypothetical protein [Roseibium limicola]MBO0344660.1 hypothetical protein [Roseibium limicola]
MAAQDELKALFAELDEHTDKALIGLRQVRSSARVSSLESAGSIAAVPLVLGAAFFSLAIVWLKTGSFS